MQTVPDNLADADLALLYLADELPTTDREAFAARLNGEAPLRTLLAELSAAQDAVFGALDAADTRDVLPSGRGAVFALVAATRDSRPVAAAKPWVRPWWLGTWTLYPLGAAAAVAIGLYAWWASIGPDQPQIPYGEQPGDRQLLAMRADANADPASLSDDQVVEHFAPITLDHNYNGRLRSTLMRLDYLEGSLP